MLDAVSVPLATAFVGGGDCRTASVHWCVRVGRVGVGDILTQTFVLFCICAGVWGFVAFVLVFVRA